MVSQPCSCDGSSDSGTPHWRLADRALQISPRQFHIATEGDFKCVEKSKDIRVMLLEGRLFLLLLSPCCLNLMAPPWPLRMAGELLALKQEVVLWQLRLAAGQGVSLLTPRCCCCRWGTRAVESQGNTTLTAFAPPGKQVFVVIGQTFVFKEKGEYLGTEKE